MSPKLHVRFISQGKQANLRSKAVGSGYTVSKMKNGLAVGVHVDDMEKAVKECPR